MGNPTRRLRNNRSGIVHLAFNGVAGCQTRTNPAAYTPTTDPVTCKHCLKQTARAAGLTRRTADIVALSDAQLDGEACVRCGATEGPMVPAGHGERGQLFECTHHRRAADETATVHALADTRSTLAEAELRYSFHSGFVSAIYSMHDVLAAAGPEPDVWAAAFHSSILTAAERTELADAAGAMMRRRRLPDTPTAPAGVDGDVCPPWCEVDDAGHVLHSRRVAVLRVADPDAVAVSIRSAFNGDPEIYLSLWSPDEAPPPARMSPQDARSLGQVLAALDADLSRALTSAADIAGGGA